MYEVIIPFCPSGAGGCQVMESVLELRTAPEEFKGGDDGTARIITTLNRIIHSHATNLPSSGVWIVNTGLYGPWPTLVAAEMKKLYT